MDPNRSSQSSERRSQDTRSCSQDVKEVDFSGFSSGINVHTCLKHLASIETEAKRLNFQCITISYDVEFVKELRHAKKKYHTDLCAFLEKIQGFSQTLKKKTEIKKDIYESIDKTIGGLRAHVDACKENIKLAQTILETLVAHEITATKHYRECVNLFAEFINRSLDLHGYGESHGFIGKIIASDHRDVNEIAADCLQTLKLLQERGPVDPFDEKIAAILAKETRETQLCEEMARKIEEQQIEKNQLISESKDLEEKIKTLEEEIIEMRKKAATLEEKEKEKMIQLINDNMAKTSHFIKIGKKIEDMKIKLEELPKTQAVYTELKDNCESLEERLKNLQIQAEEASASSNAKQAHIDELKKRSEKMEQEHSQELQEIKAETCKLEVEFHEKQAISQEWRAKKDVNEKKCEEQKQRLNDIRNQYQADKEAIKQKKALKKKNMKEKRRIKAELDREYIMLTFKMQPYH